jgi:DNA-binding IclR family transcriptional regulator
MVTASTSPKPPRIQALARASAIIDVIAAGGAEGVGLREISQATALNKTTAFNLLASLVTLRFVEQDNHSRQYRLGLRNIELGRLVQHRLHIPELARPILVDLCKKTNETVSLAVPDHLDLLVLNSYEGSQFLHATAYAGSRSMYHCTALGKAVLAQWDEPMRQTVYRLRGLPSLTPHTITDIDALEAQMPQILEQGYALDLEENEVGVSCVGTSIFNGIGEVAAAISVTGPSNRMTADVLEGFAKEVVAAANLIASANGYDGQSGTRNPRGG